MISDERLTTIKQLRILLVDELRAENLRHKFATTYFEGQLDHLQTQCPHPIDSHIKHYSVFAEDTYTSCDICGGQV
jgi:hypothetical protein